MLPPRLRKAERGSSGTDEQPRRRSLLPVGQLRAECGKRARSERHVRIGARGHRENVLGAGDGLPRLTRPRARLVRHSAFNEAPTLLDVLERVEALDFEKQIVVVDEGRPMEQELVQEWARGNPEHVVLHQENRGKGAAVRAGIPHATGEITLIQDADMEYDPVDVPALIEPIQRGVADVVYGSRLSGGARSVHTCSGISSVTAFSRS